LLIAVALAALAVASPPARSEQPKGLIGFTVEVEGDGSFWKPVIKSAKVVGIRTGSPADAAGLEVGDVILEVQGVAVAESNARRVATLVDVQPGEHLRLKVRNAAGTVKDVDIIAGSDQPDS